MKIGKDAGRVETHWISKRTAHLLKRKQTIVAPAEFPEGSYSIILEGHPSNLRIDTLSPEFRDSLYRGRKVKLRAGRELLFKGTVVDPPDSGEKRVR